MADRLARLIQRAGAARLWLIAGAVVVIIGLALAIHSGHRATSRGALRSLTLQQRPFTATIDVVGVIAPGDAVDVVAPYDGAVTSVDFVYGDPVKAGQVLLRMDGFDLTQHAKEAQAALLKAQLAAREMDNWASSPDVSRARRAKAAAEAEAVDTRRKLAETKALLDRGLVARNEYEAQAQQLRSQEMMAQAASEDLSAALRRGSGAAREAARLELEAAKARAHELDTELSQAVVKASSAGVITRPPAAKPGDDDTHVGQRLSRGQLIGSIARANALAVSFSLDEDDAQRVKVGDRASVSGGGLGAMELEGVVSSVAGEAHPSDNGGGTSTVLARVRLDPPPAGSPVIRVGASANVSIIVRDNPAAIVVPPQALNGSPPLAQVLVRDPKTGAERPRTVRLGYSAPDGVEVLSGLKPGEIVVWRTPAVR
jgi:multidrug efflux pump subunit AcrA (membrane-fusion protein)